MRISNRRRGLTLIEVLVALAILSLAMLALAPMFAMGVKVNASSSQLSVANTLAREKLEELIELPTTNPKLWVPATTLKASFANDLPLFYKPASGAVSPPATVSGSGWFPYPCVRTYTVEPIQADTLAVIPSALSDESSYDALTTVAPYYNLKLVTVTVQPSSGPFPGLRKTVQTAYVRFRNATPN